jgi:hypothetical protein
MGLSQEIQAQSLDVLTKRYKLTTPSKKLQLLTAINTLAATHDVFLSSQSDEVIKLIGKQLEKPFNEEVTAASIYSLVIEQMDRETEENRRRHRAQGHFDQKYIYQRTLRDELQDHDMSLLMPKSHGNIEVLAPVNRFDSGSIEAVREGITLALKEKHCDHIVIPIGPGHWRGIYLSKPVDATGKYLLELFDPYGPSGANAIRKITLDLLKKCGINENQITIKTTGPIHPQADGYACGDFTCAYSHKKMKEFGAKDKAYNQNLITVLDSHGNNQDLLRLASREVSKKLEKSEGILKSTEILKSAEINSEEPKFTETEKRDFLIRLGKQLSDPDKIDKAVFDREIAKISSPSGSKVASLRELDAYGVFNSDGSINQEVANQYGIKFDETRIKSRLELYGFKHLSIREMIIFESAVATVINDLTPETYKKIMALQDEYNILSEKQDQRSLDPTFRSIFLKTNN